jgi:hypothetical protein
MNGNFGKEAKKGKKNLFIKVDLKVFFSLSANLNFLLIIATIFYKTCLRVSYSSGVVTTLHINVHFRSDKIECFSLTDTQVPVKSRLRG